MNLNLSQIYSIIGRYSNAGFAKGKKKSGSKCPFIAIQYSITLNIFQLQAAKFTYK